MTNYINLTLIKIDPDRIITVDGEQYLALELERVGENGESNGAATGPSYGEVDEKNVIIYVLLDNPGISSRKITELARSKYGVHLASVTRDLQKLKKEDLVLV